MININIILVFDGVTTIGHEQMTIRVIGSALPGDGQYHPK